MEEKEEEENDTDQGGYVLEELAFSYRIKHREDKKPTKSEIREIERERKLTKWGVDGGVGIGVEKDGSSYREEQEEKNNILKLHHRLRLPLRLRIKIERDRTICSR